MKKLILLRGPAGSGKSTKCKELGGSPENTCSADDYFIRPDGKYDFNHHKLSNAHKWCLDKAEKLMYTDTPVVFVDNTNIFKKHYKSYVDFGNEYGYDVSQVVLTGDYKSIHDVPTATVMRMKENFEVDDDISMLEESYVPVRAPIPNVISLFCDDCGGRGANETTCPYSEDIHNKIVECVLCPTCERERAMDI